MSTSDLLTDEQLQELLDDYLTGYLAGEYAHDDWPHQLQNIVQQAQRDLLSTDELDSLSDDALVERLVELYRAIVAVPLYYKAFSTRVDLCRTTLRYLLESDESVSAKVDALVGPEGRFRGTGLGKSFWSMLLMALDPAHNPPWTNKTEKALRLLGMARWVPSDTPGQTYSRIAQAQRMLIGLDPRADLYTIDQFMHYVAVLEGKVKIDRWLSPPGEGDEEHLAEVRYWKVAPGRRAWNWEACRDGGFIAIGWDELGDLTGLSKSEFETRRDELVARHDDWTSAGANQVWTFSHIIQQGDRIVANRGIKEVLGIGTVSSPYHFVPGIRHGHRLPVRWDDLAARQVDEGGWRRTLVELDENRFREVLTAPAIDDSGARQLASPFSRIFTSKDEADWAFDLLRESLHRLGVQEPQDPRFAITLTDSNRRLRLNFGNWTVLQFCAPGHPDNRVGLALLDDLSDTAPEPAKWGPLADSAPTISFYCMPMQMATPPEGELRAAYERTLSAIAERFSDWEASPFRDANQPDIARTLFDRESLAELLEGGLSEGTGASDEPNVWWVNQGQTLDLEREGGYLWAPTTSKDGRSMYHWDTLNELQEDDIVLHHAHGSLRYVSRVTTPAVMAARPHGIESDEWQEEGRLVRVDYHELRPPIALETSSQSLSGLSITQGPIDSTGRAKQGYLFRFTPEALRLVQQSQPETVWPGFVELWITDISPGTNPAYTLADFAAETGFEEAELTRWVRAIERKRQVIVYGPPGTGKTYLAERLAKHLIGGGNGFLDLVQFHPAYAYEDFIQGIRPMPGADGQLDYPLVAGRFLEFCEKARSRIDSCVLIVDEINRANLARVFGEMMYLLEYRDRVIPLAAGGSLRIPSNVRIIGTMNTADRSIALVDHALRRRFAFLALYPNYDVLRRFHEATGFDPESLIGVLRRLNTQIGDRHYEVGITFFLRKDLEPDVEDIWRMEIEPYLEEYFFDQPDKVEGFRWDRVGGEILP